MTYLDNASTAMPLALAVEAANGAMARHFGNPSSLHAMGKAAREIVENARENVANALGCPAKSLIFTSCGTESANMAISGAAFKNKHLGRHIVSTEIEHDASLSALKALKNQGFDITLVPPERDGSVSAERLISAVRGDTILLAMQAVNNETGAILPYIECAAAVKERAAGAIFYLDAVQGLCKIDLELKNVDLAAISAHKIGGIKGAGALFVRDSLKIRPLLYGGGQESAARSGTEAVPAIAAFGAAARYRAENRESDREKIAALRERVLDKLHENEIDFLVNSPENSAAHILNISLDKGRSEVYIRALSEMEIFVSGGSACARGKRSHVLSAMNVPAGKIDSALRVSLCAENTFKDAEKFANALKSARKLF